MLKKGLFHTRCTVTCAYLLNVSGKIEYLAIPCFNDGSDIPINTKTLDGSFVTHIRQKLVPK